MTGGVPIFFKRCAVTRELFDLLVELRPSSTSGGLQENVKCVYININGHIYLLADHLPFTELHLVEYHMTRLEFLRAYEIRQQQTSLFGTNLEEFSGPWDPNGYNDRSITDNLITDIFVDFNTRTRSAESQDYLKTLTGEVHSWSMNVNLTYHARYRCLPIPG